ncbi:CGNR zinc finger domain-containing protein [Nonomuraea rhizosphaerae]|uniref:CGNR zinc finger domain-containing protein n=1 Tax=Nonomuraea rhizosphaerae TaxID=2665663 RepID=UPI001C5D067F|nr:CGNR zinc finger domain-containing protein [Nonomuraea rhizosphaerae]
MVPAPSGLAFVQDFLNTRARAGRTDDLLGTVRDAQTWADGAVDAWSGETGANARGPRLRAADLPRLRALRDATVELLGGNGEGVGDVALVARVDSTGRVVLEPAGSGAEVLAGILAIEVFRAQEGDVWRRLKTCRKETCPVAFYDRSPNNAGAWHDVRVCGNAVNLRASRARRRAATQE